MPEAEKKQRVWSRQAGVGAFVLAGTVLFAIGLYLIGSRQKVFNRGFDVYTDFANVSGLVTGANVQVSGLPAGELVEIQVPRQPSGPYRLKLRLDEKIHPLIRQDSMASIQTEGLVGDTYVEVDRGSDQSPECAAGCTVSSTEPFGLSDLIQNSRQLLDTMNSTLQSAGEVADNLNQTLTTFNARGRNGENGPLELKQTLANAQRATGKLAEDTEALKHNFLFRGFFHHRGYYDLSELTPAQYRTSKFVKSRSAKRVWLPADELFVPSPKGGEQISAKGKAALDQAMANFVSELPNSPLIVEGYSTQGSPAEQYRVAQQRAAEVAQYLESRFSLNPSLVGEMPLEDSPPESAGKNSWDGISLVVLP